MSDAQSHQLAFEPFSPSLLYCDTILDRNHLYCVIDSRDPVRAQVTKTLLTIQASHTSRHTNPQSGNHSWLASNVRKIE